MKKIFCINGSPRKNGSTAELLAEAARGAEKAGAESQIIHLADIPNDGCHSCFACKSRRGKYRGRCGWKDDMQLILDKLINSDGIILGTPVYFGRESGLMYCFEERLFYPALRYAEGFPSQAVKKIPLGFIYTMNASADAMKERGYIDTLAISQGYGERLFGYKPLVLYSNDTLQFTDYEKYDVDAFSLPHKLKVREEQFPLDKKAAEEMGERIAKTE